MFATTLYNSLENPHTFFNKFTKTFQSVSIQKEKCGEWSLE